MDHRVLSASKTRLILLSQLFLLLALLLFLGRVGFSQSSGRQSAFCLLVITGLKWLCGEVTVSDRSCSKEGRNLMMFYTLCLLSELSSATGAVLVRLGQTESSPGARSRAQWGWASGFLALGRNDRRCRAFPLLS